MLKKAVTPALVEKVIDMVWKDFDDDGNGVLDIKEAKRFVDVILKQMYGHGSKNLGNFSAWFAQFDTDHSGSIEKKELVGFITKLARAKQFGISDVSVYQDQICEGRHHISKLVTAYKLNSLDYLKLCDLTRKLYKCFDLDGNASLGKIEMKQLLLAMSTEMNSLGGKQMTKSAFRKWFSEIDTDNSDAVSLDELICAFCKLFKVEQTKSGDHKTYIPPGLLDKNEMIRASLRKFAVKHD